MKFMQKNDDYIIIVGCGRLGANLANTLSDDNGNVLIMDNTKDSFRRLSSDFGGLSLVGSGTDLSALRNAQIEKASAVIAVTNDDNTNIMIVQLAREMFHVPRVIARLYDPDRESVYQELGIATICPAILSAKEVGNLLDHCGKEEK